MFFGFGLGIVAAFFWAVTNLIDKYLVDRYSSEHGVSGIVVLSGLFPVVLVVIALAAGSNLFELPLHATVILLISGFLMMAWIFFYLKALADDDASVVTTLLVLAPLSALVFGYLFLHELPTPWQLVAGAIIISGALTVSYVPSVGHFKWKLLGYAIAASGTMGLMHALFKFVAIEETYWQSIFWRSLGMVMATTMLLSCFPNIRKRSLGFMYTHFKTATSLNLTNESLTLVADAIFAFSILLAPLAIVQTTESFQPIFIIIMIFVLTQFGIKTLVENQDTSRTTMKLLGITLTLGGSILLTLVS